MLTYESSNIFFVKAINVYFLACHTCPWFCQFLRFYFLNQIVFSDLFSNCFCKPDPLQFQVFWETDGEFSFERLLQTKSEFFETRTVIFENIISISSLDILCIALIACPHLCHLLLARNFLRLSVLITLWPISCSSNHPWDKHWEIYR